MNIILEIEKWSTLHHPKWLVAFRIALGISLFIKGFQFMQDHALLMQMISQTSFAAKDNWLNSVIPWVHIFGGLLILLGLFTRIAALIQIPVLIGAVFFVNLKQGAFVNGSELLFSVIVLLFLLFFLVEGGGPFSMDRILKDYNKEAASE